MRSPLPRPAPDRNAYLRAARRCSDNAREWRLMSDQANLMAETAGDGFQRAILLGNSARFRKYQLEMEDLARELEREAALLPERYPWTCPSLDD